MTTQTRTEWRLGDRAQNLAYGPLAVALYAADLPDEPQLDDLSRLAAQGVARLGGVTRVRELYQEWTALTARVDLDGLSPEEYQRAIRAMWPDATKMDRCVGLAYQRLIWSP
ncbi:hypothetical protein ACFY05_32255 [Microtetraspora fusca]|uniref:Uncharacterized protein n=1 Tax=Microtetraspora fusca TaxID=1997 RepID=A0ABW6VEJ0_MICFU